MKTALYAALVLIPFMSFAKNYCETCGRDISTAKNSRQCAGCSVSESFGYVIDLFKHPDKNLAQIDEMRRTRRLGETAEWKFICVNKSTFPIKIVDCAGEHKLDYSRTLSVKHNPKRLRFILQDAVDTYIIGGKKDKFVKHCGVYVMDNLPICLPGKNKMTLVVRRYAVDAIEYLLVADDGTGRNPRTVYGTARSGSITDFSHFY